MNPTTTQPNAATPPHPARCTDEVALAAAVRIKLRHLVHQRAIAGAVANTVLTQLGIPPLRDRFVVGARLPVTVTICANNPARALRAAAGLVVTTLVPLRVGYLRTRNPAVRPAQDPATESVTGTRVLDRVRNPRLPNQPVFTIAATVLLGVTLTATDRDTAWTQAHQQLRTDLRALRPAHVRLHIDALSKTWVRNLGPEPVTAVRHGR